MTRKDINLIAEAYASGLPRAYFSDPRGSIADRSTKTASKEEMAGMLAKNPAANKPQKMGVALGDKIVDKDSIVIGGIDREDYPDFVDAYVEYATFDDGSELSGEELEQLTINYPELVNDLAHRSAQ